MYNECGDIMITLSKIAKLAHVSVSTASKAFSMSNEVSAETREMIFDIAKQHGCFKKYYRAKYPKYVIAVICPELGSRYYADALSVIQKRLAEHNCEMCVASANFSVDAKRELLEYYDKHTEVDGFIVIGKGLENYTNINLPVATVFSYGFAYEAISVNCECMDAFSEAMGYFIAKGIKEIGFISELNTQKSLDMFKKLHMEKFGFVNEDLISVTDERFEKGGYEAMEKYFVKGNIPRAVMCAYDHMALGAIRCIYDHGLSVPEDIAIMGGDEVYESKYLNPRLSSIDTHIDRACIIATDALIEHLHGNYAEVKTSVKATLNLRKSTEL